MDLAKIVRTVSDSVWEDLQGLEVSLDVFDEFKFFSNGVCVIEAKDHFTLVHLSVVIVEHRCLNVANMKVA